MIVAGTLSLLDRMYTTAVPAIAPSAMADNYIKTNSIGLQLQAECWHEQAVLGQGRACASGGHASAHQGPKRCYAGAGYSMPEVMLGRPLVYQQGAVAPRG